MQNRIDARPAPRILPRRIGAAMVGTALTALLTAGCSTSPDLEPAAAPPGDEQARATVSDHGVGMRIHTEAWSGTPDDLDSHLSPILVSLTNDGDEPIRVRYRELELTTPTGQSLQALSPFQIDETVSQPVDTYAYPHTGFHVAPHASPHFHGFTTFGGPFHHDPLYHDDFGFHHYPQFRQLELPTDDMVRRALPEGVLQPGGKIKGYVYFPHIEDEAERATLHFDLVEAESEREIGELTVPLVADDHRSD